VIGARGRKAVRDLAARPGRSALAILAMAAGVFEITALLYKYALLQPELSTMYERTRPASATLRTSAAGDSLMERVRRVPGVGAAEARPVVVARARVGADDWIPAVLYVVRDFEDLRVDTFRREHGVAPPGPGEVLLERSALQVAKVAIGDSLQVRLPGGEDQWLRVAGTVHAEGLAPAWMEHMVPGFVSWSSPVRGEAHGESPQIRIRVAEHPLDEGWIREVADSVRGTLESAGIEVSRVSVPRPGRHPHADQMEAFLFLLLAFGILSFLLSAVLVAGMIQALMAEQVREVGIMKALGATRRQVTEIYLAEVAVLALAALAVGIPIGLWVGRAYAEFAAGILNADLRERPFPWVVVAVDLAIGLLVPLVAALGPVRRAAGITVREAIAEVGDFSPFAIQPAGRPSRWRLPRPLALSLRTAFRRRGRLTLTVAILAIGGAAFVSALNVASAWTRAVDRDFARRHFQLSVGLADTRPVADLARVLSGVREVERAEFWAGGQPYLIGPDGVPGITLPLLGPDPGSKLLDLPLASGRWLDAADSNAAVVNRAVLALHPGLRVGDSVRVRQAGRTTALPIVGIVKEMAPMPVIYAARPAVLRALDRSGDETRGARIVTRDRSESGQHAAAVAVERALAEAGMEVAGLQRMGDLKRGILDHLVIILAVLTMASLIVVVVGGLGLASTLTLSVVQRTREIGVLGAIGARPRTIALHVTIESLTIALLSWAVSLVLAAPMSFALQSATGRIFFKAPLDFDYSPLAALTWLGIVVVVALACSVYPARRAARMPVREALAHV